MRQPIKTTTRLSTYVRRVRWHSDGVRGGDSHRAGTSPCANTHWSRDTMALSLIAKKVRTAADNRINRDGSKGRASKRQGECHPDNSSGWGEAQGRGPTRRNTMWFLGVNPMLCQVAFVRMTWIIARFYILKHFIQGS